MKLKIVSIVIIILISNHCFGKTNILTQLEKSDYTKLTTHSEMMNYLKIIDDESKIMSVSVIGKSAGGKDIPALFFTEDKKFGSKRDSKPIVLLFCQQHGNEPSSKEAALILARELSGEKKNLLKNLDLILVPMVNPDGNDADSRRNGNEIDLNRNHWLLSEPELVALHGLFNTWMPEVTLDVHEYNAISKTWIEKGMIKNVDEMMGSVTNLNIDEAIFDYSRNHLIPSIGNKVNEDGFSFHRYIVGSPFDGDRMRYSTTAINDGRQSFGIYNTLSFIIEGKKYGDSLNKIEIRAMGQLSAMSAFLETVSENSGAILKIVNNARGKIIESSDDSEKLAHIQMDYYQDSADSLFKFPVFDLYEWRGVEKKFDCFHSKVKVRKSVEKPIAYVIPSGEKELIELLKKHNIKLKTLPEACEVELEIYNIRHVTEMIEEDMSVPYVDVSISNEKRELQSGMIFVFFDQPAGNLIPLLLEPQSTIGIFSESGLKDNVFMKFLQEGSEYPIYRLDKPVEVKLGDYIY